MTKSQTVFLFCFVLFCLFIVYLESAFIPINGLWFGHTAELLPACFSFFMFALGIKSSTNVNTNNCGGLVQTYFLNPFFQKQHFSSLPRGVLLFLFCFFYHYIVIKRLVSEVFCHHLRCFRWWEKALRLLQDVTNNAW